MKKRIVVMGLTALLLVQTAAPAASAMGPIMRVMQTVATTAERSVEAAEIEDAVAATVVEEEEEEAVIVEEQEVAEAGLRLNVSDAMVEVGQTGFVTIELDLAQNFEEGFSVFVLDIYTGGVLQARQNASQAIPMAYRATLPRGLNSISFNPESPYGEGWSRLMVGTTDPDFVFTGDDMRIRVRFDLNPDLVAEPGVFPIEYRWESAAVNPGISLTDQLAQPNLINFASLTVG